MNSDIRTGNGSTIDHRRLKFVTENFAALRGLDTVALGVMLFSLELKDALKDPWWLNVLTLAAVVVVVREMPSKYYERHFGRVEPKSKGPTLLRFSAIYGYSQTRVSELSAAPGVRAIAAAKRVKRRK